MREISSNLISFNKQAGTVILKISKEDLISSEIEDIVKEKNFFLKDEFHITLVGYAEGREIRAGLSNEIEDFINSMKNKDIRLDLSDQYVCIEKQYRDEYRFSIIQKIESEDLNNIRGEIDKITNKTTKPFWHVTLATKNSEGHKCDGIAVNGEEGLQTLNPILI